MSDDRWNRVDRRGRRRRGRPRARTIARKELTREELRLGALMYPPVEGIDRPRTRGECRGEERPCPWVSCRHHLYLDVNEETGSIKLNFPDLEPWELQHSCALDIAEAGARTLEDVGAILNITRERVRQVEVIAAHSFKMRGADGEHELDASALPFVVDTREEAA